MNRGRTVRKMYRCTKCRAPKMQCKCRAQLAEALTKITGLMESGMLVNHPQACSERRDENAQAYAQAYAQAIAALGGTNGND
jgi:hypothetical protein